MRWLRDRSGLLLFMLLGLLLPHAVEEHRPLGEAQSLLAPAEAWQASGAARLRQVGGSSWDFSGRGPSDFISRLLRPGSAAEFVQIRVCPESIESFAKLELMVASVAAGELDFSRHFGFYGTDLNNQGAAPNGNCLSDAFPRRNGDAEAVLQLRYVGAAPPEPVVLHGLSAMELEENPLWRALRYTMLLAGLLLITRQMLRYRTPGARLRSWLGRLGLAVVIGILFGCLVPVTLKADIFALLFPGRNIAVPATDAALLAVAFPLGDFAFFSLMHTLLFAAATFLLCLVHRQAWLDLVLLAAMTESLQIFVPGRGPGLDDVLIDVLGIVVGYGLFILLWRSQRVRFFLQD